MKNIRDFSMKLFLCILTSFLFLIPISNTFSVTASSDFIDIQQTDFENDDELLLRNTIFTETFEEFKKKRLFEKRIIWTSGSCRHVFDFTYEIIKAKTSDSIINIEMFNVFLFFSKLHQNSPPIKFSI